MPVLDESEFKQRIENIIRDEDLTCSDPVEVENRYQPEWRYEILHESIGMVATISYFPEQPTYNFLDNPNDLLTLSYRCFEKISKGLQGISKYLKDTQD